MKNKMILKRIISFMCMLMVCFCALGVTTPYYAYTTVNLQFGDNPYSNVETFVCDVVDCRDRNTRNLGCVVSSETNIVCIMAYQLYPTYSYGGKTYENVYATSLYYFSESPLYCEEKSCVYFSIKNDNGDLLYCIKDMGGFPVLWDDITMVNIDNHCQVSSNNSSCHSEILDKGLVGFDISEEDAPPIYDGTIGYLKNFSHSIVYKKGILQNYNNDSRVDRWKFDKVTTSGLDLSQGGYSIKHYVRPVLVKGYEDNDVIEKYDRYFVGTYPAKNGYVQYLDENLTENLKAQGYDGIGFVDAYLLGRFVLQWHYFEIVNDATGASGGYVCLKPKDADENNLGTEYEVIAVNDSDDIIDSYEPDVAYRGEGTYITSEDETIDDAFSEADKDIIEQKENTSAGELLGVNSFTNLLSSVSGSVGNVSDVIGSFFGCLPTWVLSVFGLSIALGFLLFIIKILRG